MPTRTDLPHIQADLADQLGGPRSGGKLPEDFPDPGDAAAEHRIDARSLSSADSGSRTEADEVENTENTRAFAIVGPGSEWFWIALQFFALAGTFYAIYRQLRAQQIEIQESTKAQLSLGYHNAIRLGQRPLEMLIEDEKRARIATIGYAKPETLNEVEWARFGNFMFLQFNAWEFFYYQNIDRQIPKELWIGADHCYKDLIEKSPGLPRFWSEWEVSYDEPFRSYVTQEFANRPASVAAEG